MKTILFFTCLSLYALGFSQSNLTRADKLFETNSYTKAASLYTKHIKNSANISVSVYLKAADANYFISNMRMASIYYKDAYQKNNGLDEPYISRYYRSLRSVREYKKADEIFRTFLEKTGTQTEIRNFEKERDQFNEMIDSDKPSRFTLRNLDINTEYSDFGAVIYDDQVVFSSARPGASKELYAWNEQPFLSLFVADTVQGGNLERPKLFLKQASTDFHDATIAFTKQSDVVYFASSNTEKNKLVLDAGRNNNFKLYRGIIEDSKITQKEPLYFNSDTYSVGQPFVSSDGNFLFFVSDMPGGFGEADIYYSKIYDDGLISNPINAGETINTSGNDFFPYLIGQTFYFSSNGHIGFGGLDIYEATFTAEQGFENVQNIGKNVNTSFDDFAITFNPDEQTGYISSNRMNGKGDDDIYWFYQTPLTCDQVIVGTVTNKQNRESLADAIITVKDSLGTILIATNTTAQGRYRAKTPCNTKVNVSVSKEGFVEMTKSITTGTNDGEDTNPLDFQLNKIEDIIVTDNDGNEKIKLDPIFFEYDKWEITPKAESVLTKAVEVMKDIPSMIIKIEAHTDSRGSDDYNLMLSNKRANATQAFLYDQGIAESRIISAIGYGESRPLNSCTNGVPCTDQEHFKNRRSNFFIVKR